MFGARKKIELSPRLKFGVGRGYSQNQILKFSAIVCLILAVGLALNALWMVMGTNKKDLPSNKQDGPMVLGASDVKTASESPVQFIEYKVQKGDTLFNLSQKFNIKWGTIATINNLNSPFYISPGQTLKIPK